jgi:arylsulfatase A-like enzyme
MIARSMARFPSCAALIATLLALGCTSQVDDRPSLLLITVDTLRPDRLACYGGDPEVGTGICALANQGTRFVWGFSPAPSTAPSIASILTSSWPSSHGVTQFATTVLSERARTLAEYLSDAGYDTAAFVANPVLRRGRQLERGFAIYDDRMTRRERNWPDLREREAGELSDAALAWLRVARRPWFLWVHYQDPHGPYEPPHATRRRDPPDGRQLPLLKDHSGYQGIPAYQELPGLRSLEAYQQRYQDEIRHVDLHVARLVAGADDLGPRPWVVLTADHAEAFGEDGYYFAHGHSVAMDQIRVPLIVRPGEPGPGWVSTRPASGVDVAPTLLRAAGLPVPETFQGEPLPLRAEEESQRPRTLLAEHRARAAIVVGSTYYARDRHPLAAGTPDEITGGVLLSLPPRFAKLSPDGRLPEYRNEPEKSAARLESLLTRVLQSSEESEFRQTPELTESDREALSALGYLE